VIQRPPRQLYLAMTESHAVSVSLRALGLGLLFGEQDTSEMSVEARYSVSAPVAAPPLSAVFVPESVHISSAVPVMPFLTQCTQRLRLEENLFSKSSNFLRKEKFGRNDLTAGNIANLTGFSAMSTKKVGAERNCNLALDEP
jgi:hypothetical protein